MNNEEFNKAVQALKSTEDKLVLVGNKGSADTYAAALALHLFFKSQSNSTVVAADLPTVELSSIRGIDQVTNQLPSPNLVISLDEAVGMVEKVSYFIEGTQLKLVVHPQPQAKQFDPKNIHISPGSNQVQTVVVLGANSLNDLGAVLKDQKIPEKASIIVLSVDSGASAFGQINLIDNTRASVSEITAGLLEAIGLPNDKPLGSDIALNLLAGIRNGTQNFNDPRVAPETFELAARLSRLASYAMPTYLQPLPSTKKAMDIASEDLGFKPATSLVDKKSDQDLQPPVAPTEPEPDWLTPKIYKGTSLL